jgi:hypothetical protein
LRFVAFLLLGQFGLADLRAVVAEFVGNAHQVVAVNDLVPRPAVAHRSAKKKDSLEAVDWRKCYEAS